MKKLIPQLLGGTPPKPTKTEYTVLRQLVQWNPSGMIQRLADEHRRGTAGGRRGRQATPAARRRQPPAHHDYVRAEAVCADLKAGDVCVGSIELFFKELKQTCLIRDFVGYNENAVRWQVWTGLLLRFMRHAAGWELSFSRLAGVVRAAVWVKRDLAAILKTYGSSTRQSAHGRGPAVVQSCLQSVIELRSLTLSLPFEIAQDIA